MMFSKLKSVSFVNIDKRSVPFYVKSGLLFRYSSHYPGMLSVSVSDQSRSRRWQITDRFVDNATPPVEFFLYN
ncbi:MAG: hypothetical protein AB2637_04840, partial [Candidatus Thiodiazotropha sp.]